MALWMTPADRGESRPGLTEPASSFSFGEVWLKNMLPLLIVAVCLLSGVLAIPVQRATDEEIRTISAQIWDADSNRIDGADVQYNVNGPTLFTYVNEARFTGTYAAMIAIFDNYIPETGIPETCSTPCRDEEDAFLDEILRTEPIRLLHSWLHDQGLASASESEFKNELRQYWFMNYTRSGGPLDSSGFEHVFVGEIKNNAVSGSHNWVNFYFEEKSNDFVYGNYQGTCVPEIVKFSFDWIGYPKSISSAFMRTSPELEVALGTLCLLTRVGTNCPVRVGGVDMTWTAWDMTGLPTTIGTSYPNC